MGIQHIGLVPGCAPAPRPHSHPHPHELAKLGGESVKSRIRNHLVRALIATVALLSLAQCGVDEEVYLRDTQALKDQLSELELSKSEVVQSRDRCLADYAALANEKGAVAGNLQEALRQIDELKAVAAKRKALLDGITASLQQMVSAGTITVVQRKGRLIVQIAEAILFDFGKSKLKDGGIAALAELAPKLAQVNREFQVTGHTDNRGDVMLNWRLSLDRALTVLTTMTENGYPPERLSAAGFAYFNPVATNETDEGRQSNRRVEIALVPNLEDLQFPSASLPASCREHLAEN